MSPTGRLRTWSSIMNLRLIQMMLAGKTEQNDVRHVVPVTESQQLERWVLHGGMRTSPYRRMLQALVIAQRRKGALVFTGYVVELSVRVVSTFLSPFVSQCVDVFCTKECTCRKNVSFTEL